MAAPMSDADLIMTIDDEIEELKASLARLTAAKHEKARKSQFKNAPSPASPQVPPTRQTQDHDAVQSPRPLPTLGSSTHFLLLLSDSALPLGAFAFSSGLESFLAHNARAASATFSTFLPSSLSSFASTTLPFVLAAHREPASVAALDDQLDAAIVCTVGRRASVAQGRALLSVWERSFRSNYAPIQGSPSSASEGGLPGVDADGVNILKEYSTLLRDSKADPPLVSAHLAPLFGAVCAIFGLSLHQTAYVFMLSHVKALISAAVRASMFGPFQAQKLLAAGQVQSMIDVVIAREWDTPVEEAGQSVPVMDLWIGRHELLYSRIFNS